MNLDYIYIPVICTLTQFLFLSLPLILASPSVIVSNTPTSPSNGLSQTYIIFISVTVIFLFILILIIVGFVISYIICGRRRDLPDHIIEITDTLADTDVSSSGVSSSLRGPRLLKERTMSDDVTEISVIGQGRFGKVWRCELIL